MHILIFWILSVALASQPTKRLPDADRGGELYLQNCWMCHGKKGQGNGPASEAFSTESPKLAKVFHRTAWESQIRVIMDGRGDMPAFSQVMARSDAKRILIWLEDPKTIKPKKKPVEDSSKKTSSPKNLGPKVRKRD